MLPRVYFPPPSTTIYLLVFFRGDHRATPSPSFEACRLHFFKSVDWLVPSVSFFLRDTRCIKRSVVRCFEDSDIIHVEGSVDPVRDIDIINIELALADMAQASRQHPRGKPSLTDFPRFVRHAALEFGHKRTISKTSPKHACVRVACRACFLRAHVFKCKVELALLAISTLLRMGLLFC